MLDKVMIEKLRARGIRDIDIEMWREKYSNAEDPTYKDIAAKFKIKSPNTVSKRIKKVQRAILSLANDEPTQGRSVAIQPRGVAVATPPVSGGGEYSLSVPTSDPFSALQSFQQLTQITNAGGAVFGAGASSLYQAFTREDIPYEKRLDMAMKGGSVLLGGFLAVMETFKQINIGVSGAPVVAESGTTGGAGTGNMGFLV